ncbi:hypothetical protein NL676_012212 [Syzygium grande]|nr:hypothetical protein NL676_012212 [Syzygium grande]
MHVKIQKGGNGPTTVRGLERNHDGEKRAPILWKDERGRVEVASLEGVHAEHERRQRQRMSLNLKRARHLRRTRAGPPLMKTEGRAEADAD